MGFVKLSVCRGLITRKRTRRVIRALMLLKRWRRKSRLRKLNPKTYRKEIPSREVLNLVLKMKSQLNILQSQVQGNRRQIPAEVNRKKKKQKIRKRLGRIQVPVFSLEKQRKPQCPV